MTHTRAHHRSASHRSRRRTAGQQSAAVLLALAAIVVATSGSSPARAASEGSDSWGPQGHVSTSDSAVTVHWDNTGDTPATSVVPRDATQVLAHSGGTKTYADLSPALNDVYAATFGGENGVAGSDGTPGLQMQVSQTQDLVNQSVLVGFSGVGARSTQVYVFQCWGRADETAPDPAHCASYPASGAIADKVDEADALLAPADSGAMALTGIDGTDRTALGVATSNGLNVPIIRGAASTANAFVVFTGAESSFLGCGTRDDGAPSTDTCWLVAVPFNQALVANTHALHDAGISSVLTPSLWAQRMQVKLDMAPVQTACPNGQARTLAVGSELLPTAMQFWTPGLCAGTSISLGYTKIGDEQARQQYTAGAQNVIFTTAPVAGSTSTVYAPVALSGVVVAYVADNPTSGQQVTDLKLTPRLVAKLLTQNYQVATDAVIGSALSTKAPWTSAMPQTLSDDPEFKALNPDARKLAFSGSSGADLIVSNMRSDALAQVWDWLLADHDAKAFLDGCPDPYGMTINPFFSTRSYAECAGQTQVLDAATQAKIDATDTPDTFTYEPATYPSDGIPFPQPGWYARDAQLDAHGEVAQLPLTLGDIHAHTNTLADAGSAAARLAYPSNTVWCPAATDVSCINGTDPGVWKSAAAGGQGIGQRGVFAITDAATAARYQMPTAKLCDDTGEHCVGADTTSLTKAAAEFVDSDTPGVSQPAGAPDYAGGAYPLAMAVYGAVQTDRLARSDAATIAAVLSYVSTTGQRPGTKYGDLPPGYAPLTDTLVAQTAATVHTLLNLPAPDDETTPPGDDQTPPVTTGSLSPVVPVTSIVPVTTPPGTGDVPGGSTPIPTPTPTPSASSAVAGATTPDTVVGLPRYGLVAGLGGASASLLAAPMLGSRRKLRAL